MSLRLIGARIVIYSDVLGAQLVPRSPPAVVYEPIIAGRPVFVSFQTVAELRYRALRRGWGGRRLHDLETRIATAETVHTGPDLIPIYARIRADCERLVGRGALTEERAP